MKLLTTLGKGQGYLKAGFLGFQGSGKTYTAVMLAAGVRDAFGLKGPIAFVDTENATEYVAPLVQKMTGLDLVGLRTRKFDDLIGVANECADAGVSVLIADSMTHFWRSLCDSYLAGVNQRRERAARAKGWNFAPRLTLEFQDWGQVKGEWARWTDCYLNLPLHIIICGRAGYEYDMEVNTETNKKELVKTGVKMKTEGEFGFEPSLLVQMGCEQEPDQEHKGRFIQIRTAQVIKDRFAVIDGKTFGFPGRDGDKKAELKEVMAAFGPHVQMLKPGAHSTVPTNVVPMDVSEEGDAQWARERREREIICEEIQGAIASAIPGQGADDKKRKADLLLNVFGTRSWTAVQGMKSDSLRSCLRKLHDALGERPVPPPTDDDVPMSFPPTQQQAAPVNPATQPKPTPEKVETSPEPPQSEPERKVQTQAPAAPASGGDDELIPIIGQDRLAAAVSWMMRNAWLTSEQAMQDNPFAALKPEHREKVKARPSAFLRAIGAK